MQIKKKKKNKKKEKRLIPKIKKWPRKNIHDALMWDQKIQPSGQKNFFKFGRAEPCFSTYSGFHEIALSHTNTLWRILLVSGMHVVEQSLVRRSNPHYGKETGPFAGRLLMSTFEPRHERTCRPGLQPGKTQTSLLMYRD